MCTTLSNPEYHFAEAAPDFDGDTWTQATVQLEKLCEIAAVFPHDAVVPVVETEHPGQREIIDLLRAQAQPPKRAHTPGTRVLITRAGTPTAVCDRATIA